MGPATVALSMRPRWSGNTTLLPSLRVGKSIGNLGAQRSGGREKRQCEAAGLIFPDLLATRGTMNSIDESARFRARIIFPSGRRKILPSEFAHGAVDVYFSL